MISIFEVFALNRNEVDFIENLEIYGQMIMDQHEGREDEEPTKPEEDLSDPKLKILFEVKDQLSEDEYDFAKMQLKENNKRIMMIFNVYENTKDLSDFLHSLKRIFKMNRK